MNYLLLVTIGFASGVMLRSLFVFGLPVVAFVLVLATLFVVVAYPTPRKAYSLCGVFLLFLALGAFRYGLADAPLPQSFASEIGTKVTYEGVVVADPDVRDKNQRVTVRVAQGGETTKVLAVAERYPAVSAGERVRVSGTLERPQPFSTNEDSGRVFRYDKFLEKDGIYFLVTGATLTSLAPASPYSLPALFARIKHTFLYGLSAALPEPYASLAGGIVIGGKSGLGNELKEAFIVTGLVQIIVLSGYNVMIVAEWVMYLIGLLKFRRGASAVAGALALILFVAIAGASSTAIRAALMALIALYARASGKTYAASRALIVVIFLMLVVNPLTLAFDPGFGLSVVATAGLIWLAPLIEFKLTRLTNAFWRNIIATTLAAQIAVLPLLLYQTGTLSLVAIPANLLVAALMPFAMGFAALAGLAGIVLGTAAWPLALPAYLIALYIITIARVGSELPLASLHLPAFHFAFVVLAYAALIYIAATKRASMTLQLIFSKKAST